MVWEEGNPLKIEILIACSFKNIEAFVQDLEKAMKMGLKPRLVPSGMGGVYCFKNSKDEDAAIVKPADEELDAPNNPKQKEGNHRPIQSVRVGEGAYREVAACLLDRDQFANVPPTALIKIFHPIFKADDEASKTKIASIQKYVPHDYNVSDRETRSFPEADVRRIAILDIRTFNTDRNDENLLVTELNDNGFGLGRVKITPIDHGLCLPENLEDPYFVWQLWAQASTPFTEEELKFIEDLDPQSDADMLEAKLPKLPKGCLRVLIVSTTFLKMAAASGLTLSKIGAMMARPNGEGPSELERICMDAMVVAVREAQEAADHDHASRFGTNSELADFYRWKQEIVSDHDYVSKAEKNEAEAKSFVNFKDMKEDVWPYFLERFQEELRLALKFAIKSLGPD